MDISIPQNTPQEQANSLKFCSGCNKYKPTATQFYSDKSKSDGLTTLCKKCKSPEGKARRDREKALNAPPEGFRKCTACDAVKPATTEYFDLRDAKRGTLHSECKPCKAKRWQRDLAKKPGYWCEHYENNIEYHRERVKRYNHEHAEERKQHRREYDRLHPEVYRAYNAKRRSRRKGVGGKYTKDDVIDQHKRQKGKCYYCHVKVGNKYHVDHIVPLTRDGSSNDKWNIVIACSSCNSSKSNKLLHEWHAGGRLL